MDAKEVTLIKRTYTKNNIGSFVESATTRNVVGNIASVSGQEFSNAGELGIKAELIVKVWQTEYQQEDRLQVDGIKYLVYRTYADKNGRVELYCQKDVGV